MKNCFLFLLIFTLPYYSKCQQKSIVIEGGYSISKTKYSYDQLIGWSTNVNLEYQKNNQKITQGLSIGYMSFSGNTNQWGVQQDLKSWCIPIMYYFNKNIGFKKATFNLGPRIGYSFTNDTKPGYMPYSFNNNGFVVGLGGGAKYRLNQRLFLLGEYKIIKLIKSNYYNGLVQSITLGIGTNLK